MLSSGDKGTALRQRTKGGGDDDGEGEEGEMVGRQEKLVYT